MTNNICPWYRRALYAFVLIFITMNAVACGRTQASSQDTSTEEITQAIRDYGRGHLPLAISNPAEKPSESSQSYEQRITSLLMQRDFAQLEKIAAQNRLEKARLVGGIWKNYEFMVACAYPATEGKPIDAAAYSARMDLLNQWIAQFPQSAAAHIALAQSNLYYAFFIRGTGAASEVSEKQWEIFHERTAQAHKSLLIAASLKERDREWYSVMLELAQAEGWDRVTTRELFDQAVAYEREYYHFYRLYSNYIEPEWYGKPGEFQSFVEESTALLPEPNRAILYFQIMGGKACYCDSEIHDILKASYPELREGYTSLTDQYGSDNLIASRFAVMAFAFNDRKSAREAFTHITFREPGIFLSEDNFDWIRNWANSPE